MCISSKQHPANISHRLPQQPSSNSLNIQISRGLTIAGTTFLGGVWNLCCQVGRTRLGGDGGEMDFLEGAGEAVRLSLIGLVDVNVNVVGVVGNGCLSHDDGEGLEG